MYKDDSTEGIGILFSAWIGVGLILGGSFALSEVKCEKKSITAYLNPVYIVICKILKPRWEE